MTEKKRLTAAILAAAVLFIVIASFHISTMRIGHHCSGEDCSICCQIRACESVIKVISRICFCGTISFLLIAVFQTKTAVIDAVFSVLSPITLKVKLLD